MEHVLRTKDNTSKPAQPKLGKAVPFLLSPIRHAQSAAIQQPGHQPEEAAGALDVPEERFHGSLPEPHGNGSVGIVYVCIEGCQDENPKA
jgi:hypothetical protein